MTATLSRLGTAAVGLAAGTAALWLATPHAQGPSSLAQPTFRAEVNLVEVSAVVTGGDGRSVDDLTAADFELLEDGVARRLVSVRRLSAHTSNRIGGARSAPNLERLATSSASADAPAFVLLLDDLDTSRRDAHRVIRAAEQAFAALPETALVSVLTTSGLGGALLTLEPPSPRHLERIRAFRGQLLVRALPPAGVSPGGGGSTFSDGMSGTSSLDTADPTRSARRAAVVAATAEILGRSGARRKVLLWVSQTMGVSTEDPQGSRAAQWRALTAALDNDVTVYVLDPRGNTGGVEDPDEKRSGGTLRVGGSAMPLEVDDMVAVPLTQITRETGGRYVTMANDYGEMMGEIIRQNSSSYLLVYESMASRTPGRHRVDVRVRRPGTQVSARRAFIVEPPAEGVAPQRTAEDSVLRRTLLGSAPHGRLRLTVQAAPRFATGKSGVVSVTVLAEDGDGPPTSAVDVVFATFDDEGRTTHQQQVRLEPPPAGTPLEFTTELSLPRGRHQLRVAAATTDAAKTGLVITPVEVLDAGRQLVMAPPLVLQQVSGQVAPTVARRFASGTLLGVQTEVAGRAVQDGMVTVSLTLAGADGAVVKSAETALDVTVSRDRRRATGLIDTTGLAAGAYVLTVEASPGRSERAVRHAIALGLDSSSSATASAAWRHSVVAHGPVSRHRAPGTFVIRDEVAWREFWRHLPTRQAAPDIDFSRVTLLAIVGAGGEAQSRPVVASVVEQHGTAVVRWHAERAPSGPLTQPFTVVALPTRVESVRFERAPVL